MDAEKYELIRDIKLDNTVIEKGTALHATKVDDDTYYVFHFTGWWAVPKEYFE